jgi:catechol 2,3-dioxygenase-like lactoylglutathione lyase family enzyme
MKRTLLGAICCVAAIPIVGAGDAAVRTVGYDNVHIRVSDPPKAVDWYVKHLGGTTPAAGQVYFGKALIAVVKTTKPQPSAGSAIDHIGFSFGDISSKVKDLEAAGAKMISAPQEAPGMFKYAYVEDPWGIKIELVEDSEMSGFHHIHLRVKDPPATLKWYRENFGGESAKLRGRLDGLRYDGVWLFAAQAKEDPAPSEDRAIMSFGLRVANIQDAANTLQGRGIKLPVAPRQLGNLWYAFAEDPNGVRVELLQRPSE